MKKPELGTYVEHTVHGLRDTYEHAGLVYLVTTAQAFYEEADGNQYSVLFSEDWKPVAKRQKPSLVESPSVWRNHQSRTCIVVEATADTVKYIPIINEVLEVYECDETRFRQEYYVEPIDYPVDRAARLYAEYARSLGASSEVIKYLKQFTSMTKEDIEMAESAKSKAKAAAKKKAPAKKKAAAKKDTAPKKPRITAASRFKELIMKAGANGQCTLTDDQIFEKVQKEFDLDDKKRSYVAWYRNDLVKKGEKPPEPKGGAKAKAKAGRPAKKKK